MTGKMRGSQRRDAVSALVLASIDSTRFALVALIGALGGFIIPSLGPLRQPLLVVVWIGLCGKLFGSVLRRQFTFAWGLIAFLCATEPAFREHAPVLPYYALEYALLGSGGVFLALTTPRKGARTQYVIAYGIYLVLEVTGSFWARSWTDARGILVPSALMFLFLVNSRRARLSPSDTTFVLASYVVGAVTLAAFAVRSYMAGTIVWQGESSFDASGGMPPNHISVLVSVAVFACIVLIEHAPRIQRIALLGLATLLGTFMVLTFSRGGTVILLGAILLYYVVLRPIRRKTLFALIAVTIVGRLVSYGTREITEGKVVDRFSDTRTTNRFTIVVQGWGIYVDNPVVGVGTSNFRLAMVETEFGRITGAHNELIRAAAEHGTLGLFCWLWFISSAALAALRGGDPLRVRRGLRVVFLAFVTVSMFYNGLKLSVQPMLILLALAAFTASDSLPKPSRVRTRALLRRDASPFDLSTVR